MILKFLLTSTFITMAMLNVFSQSTPVSTVDSLDGSFLNWFDKSPSKNKIEGAGVDRTYSSLIGNKKAGRKIIVAVIDGGVDTAHVDLKGRIWVNTGEIPGNGIDDDKNGYIDDIHGWNFLGNKNGENIRYANFEEVRIMRRMAPRFSGVDSINQVAPEDTADYRLYKECQASFEKKKKKFETIKSNITNLELNLSYADKIIKDFLGKDTFTIADLKGINTNRDDVNMVKKFLITLDENGFTRDGLNQVKEMVDARLDKQLNPDFNPRPLIGDNPDDINDTDYGNNDVTGPDAFHGTFVSGIIAAIRNNGFGIDGIASDVEIMSVRAIPDGDERDKDVALAIRYAVDNGADIINMSFGKDFSPHKDFVDAAVKYAEAHHVLLVHAAGNDANDLDHVPSYPENRLNDGTIVNNWITVGASSKTFGKDLVGSFSNYGQKEVDLFAPGVNIISLYPGNRYDMGDGTSFASPVVAGVAALILSYHPDLSAIALKDLILKNTDKHRRKKVYLPSADATTGEKIDNGKTVRFDKLSVTGGVVNAYNAFRKAGK